MIGMAAPIVNPLCKVLTSLEVPGGMAISLGPRFIESEDDHRTQHQRRRQRMALVESIGSAPVAIVVERAMYSNSNGVTWAAGTNALGSRLQP